MATYAVGDIQGCLKPLEALLEKVRFDPSSDRLWAAGDVVNRGPDSLQTLRLLYHLRHSFTMVLGNHDLHLLAVAAGARPASRSDTLDAILNAPDRDLLLEWLRRQPLIYHDTALDYCMVHAGIPPQWSLRQALRYAGEVEAVLRSGQIHRFLDTMYGNEPDRWYGNLVGPERWRAITNYFTRMRFCTAVGQLELRCKGDADRVPSRCLPWYAHTKRKTRHQNIIFGHWAALAGQADHDHVFALDTGCVWGGKLTMMRLEDRAFFSVDADG